MPQHEQTVTLLVIDDDPAIVRLLEKVITRTFGEQINIESLVDPRDARTRINQGGVDILLTDLEMPGINGLELLRCAKRRNPCTQVLFLTGHSSQEALLDSFELGATDYLLKPVDQVELLELIEQSYRRHVRWRNALAETWSQQKSQLKS
ncbi:MAG: transcriptional regulator [Blastopirellula sp.]|nr:MAG: transcriptional regulator [Blastopirellula sp.]